MSEHTQFAFDEIIEAAEEAERGRADAHRAEVQEFFDGLTLKQQQQLSALFAASEWLSCQALSAAAGDYHRSESKQRPISTNGSTHEVAECPN